MAQIPDYLTPEKWLEQITSCGEAHKGGVIKRQIRDVERLAGRGAFLDMLDRKGFQAVENGRHFVIFCNDLPIRRVR
ncbi:hypothetical protein [Pseudoponticoccus marisrubri]|uniref:N-(5'-phosphoribosyl)anthranilate isomerase n=1 Tax=Pseudoponticoccus marisrubri TaxID=1685382 RepID=A0A0W7WL58_9RHOB|nr:hypothetical protein [Pseudoponticoccus marisrubri]KUF11255.1 N-(5'-phosphoribosyl)anthranilate isomerase [Pseudoponticoccus marisrubri]